MKYLAWIIGLFVTAVALTTLLSHNSGYVLLVYPPYRVELSLIFFVVLSLVAFVIGYGLVRFAITVLKLPSYVRKYRMNQTQAKAHEKLEEVLSAFFEGRYAAAEKAATRAMESGETSALYPIIAARSAHELREYKKRDAYLSAAEGKKIGDTTMRLMATSKFMLDQRNPKAALNALQELRDSGIKGHVGAMSLELKAQQQAGNWDAVLKLLDQLEKRSSIEEIVAGQLRQQAWQEKIRQQKNLTGVKDCIKNMPAVIKRRPEVISVAVQALMHHGDNTHARQILTDSLNEQWNNELISLYGDCVSDDAVAQIEQAEKWLNQHQQDNALLLALGKLCLHQKLWGKARNYLDASISIEPSHAGYTALAQLSEKLGKSADATRYYQMAQQAA